MKKTLLTFGILALGLGTLIAGPVSQQKAQNIAAKFLSTTQLGKQMTNMQLSLVAVANTRNAVDYYIFNVQGNNGFVVVSGDDCVKPILAYATTGSYSAGDVAPGFRFTLDGYRDDIRYVREHNILASADIVSEWESIEQTGCIRDERNARTVDVLCPTLWNQGKYYNDQCPEDPEGPNGRVYAGCVATAMGQVLYYWNHPVQGSGSHSYSPVGGSYPTQIANFGETEYHWELMPLKLDSTSTQEEIFHVAQVLHHLGISVEMMYSPNGSGAYSSDVADALHNYFGFAMGNFIQKDGYWGGGYTNQEWIAALKGELDQLHPIYYSGSDESGAGGHAFVCDGYDENDYFHFNWGWDGVDNAFCAIGALNTTKYAFNVYNTAVIDLCPQTDGYYQRPERVANLSLNETDSMDGVVVAWTNPTTDIAGNALAGISAIQVRRNFEVVATFENVEMGVDMTYTDMVPESRIYEYSVIAINETGASIPVYEKILVGEKCELVFQLNDEGGDGWKGASISVTDANNNRIAIITLEEGAEQTISVPLLRGELKLFWNHGWFHNNEQYDTDFECSFRLLDGDGNVLFTSPEELVDGLLFTYYNPCGGGQQLICYPVENLEGAYTWNNPEEYGVTLSWSNPSVTAHIDHFNIYRCLWVYAKEDPIAVVPADELGAYVYFDMLADEYVALAEYMVTAVFVDGEEQCESEGVEVAVEVTGLAETASCGLYPNPTNDSFTVEVTGMTHVTVVNMVGQVFYSADCNTDRTNISLGHVETGLYMVRVTTANGEVNGRINVVR